MFTHGWLVSELDSRDPRNDLSDIDTGKYLQALQEVPQSVRQLMEDGDCHVEVDLIDDHWRVTKIVKKREPEYSQGTESHFVLDGDGRRISVSEDEIDKLCGITHDPEDVYNRDDVEFVGVESEHHVPHDVWDVIFDATECIRECRKVIDDCREREVKLEVEVLEQIAEETIYSANWFPYPQDKRIHSAKGKKIARAIAKGLTKSQMSRMMRDPVSDNRYEVANNLRQQAETMPLGRQRADLMRRSVELKEAADRDSRAPSLFSQGLSRDEKSKLWNLWRNHELETKGKVELTSWQFSRLYTAKLQRRMAQGEITTKEASSLFTERMKALYDVKAVFAPIAL